MSGFSAAISPLAAYGIQFSRAAPRFDRPRLELYHFPKDGLVLVTLEWHLRRCHGEVS